MIFFSFFLALFFLLPSTSKEKKKEREGTRKKKKRRKERPFSFSFAIMRARPRTDSPSTPITSVSTSERALPSKSGDLDDSPRSFLEAQQASPTTTTTPTMSSASSSRGSIMPATRTEQRPSSTRSESNACASPAAPPSQNEYYAYMSASPHGGWTGYEGEGRAVFVVVVVFCLLRESRR